MSESSVRLLRRLAVSMAPVVLAGAGYAARDTGAIERIPFYYEVTFSGQSSVVPKMASADADAGVGLVPMEAGRLFRDGGKGPRADRYHASRRGVDVAKAPIRAYLAASAAGLELGAAKPNVQDIDRTRKADRLVMPEVALSKSAIVADAGPVRPEAAPLAVEGAPLAHRASAPQPASQDAPLAQNAPQASTPQVASADGSAPAPGATPASGAAPGPMMMSSLAAPQEETKVQYSGSTASVNAPAGAVPVAGAVPPGTVPARSPEGGKDEWPQLYQNAKLSASESGEGGVFGGLTEKEFRAREMRCMALAIYFEARDEPIKGQIAVAQVIMNRVKSPYYPKTICGVIYQGAEHRNSCQFSFACDGQADRPTEKKEWATSIDVAKQVTYGKVYLDDIGDCTHYHATYVHPDWIKLVRRVTKIGGHIFYKASFAPVHLAEGEL